MDRYYYKSKISHEDLNLNVFIYGGDKKELWNKFKEHHYLSADMNMASTIFVCYLDDILVGMCGVLPVPSGVTKHGFRPSRTVILPDYQNLGIGTRLSEFIGDYYLNKGYKFYYRSSHLRLKTFWEHSPYWVATSHNAKKRDPDSNFSNANIKEDRICASYEYMGHNYTLPHIEIRIEYTDDINIALLKEDLKLLKQNHYVCVITGNVNEDNPIDLVCQELGIRTQLLYYRGKLIENYKNKNIITKYDEEMSKKVRKYYDLCRVND